jgi:zinc transport system ATP-binding protein
MLDEPEPRLTASPAHPLEPKPTDRAHNHRDHAHHNHDHDHAHHDHTHHDHDYSVTRQPFLDAALISARQIGFKRGDRSILQGIDIDISASEIVTVIGPNGAGKTTLVRLLLGIEKPDTGHIQQADNLVVGYVPQRFDLERAIPMTVDRFLALGAKRGGTTSMEAKAGALAEVGADGLGARQFNELSGGELQRVLIARALLRKPSLLVLDEPVRGVDFQGEAELYALITQLRTDRGLGVLLVSHDLHVVMAQSDRVICINRHVCCSGVPSSVAQHPEYARMFGPNAVRAFALYQHEHDHDHDLTGEPRRASRVTGPKSAAHRTRQDPQT